MGPQQNDSESAVRKAVRKKVGGALMVLGGMVMVGALLAMLWVLS